MTVRTTLVAWSAVAVISASPRSFAFQDQFNRFLLACSVFPANTTEAALQTRFGLENVTRGPVMDPYGAEGDTAEGTILFAKDADASLEISWKDATRRQPALIRKLAAKGRWRTSSGIALGTDLKTVEKLNGRPFRLAGMAFDAQGTVLSWSGGRLEAQDSTDCHVGVRLRVESPPSGPAAMLDRQVTGDREFSSGHPAMQALNPTVYELAIWYGRKTR
jgi:hypothetical protein